MGSEDLFDQFKALYSDEVLNLPDRNNRFIKDGIIVSALFSEQKTKVLFIAKEHNDLGHPDDKDYKADYRLWWQEGVYLQFAKRISEWAFYLLDWFHLAYDQLTDEQRHKALQSIAFINVKKASGKSLANPEHICQYIIESQSLLNQQIQGIAPTLIVCCFRYDYYVELLFASEEADSLKMVSAADNTYSLGKWNGIDVINFYHPSARKNKKWLYDQLREAYKAVQAN